MNDSMMICSKQLALWRGSTPTVARACLLNMGQLGVYSQAKTSVAKLTGLPEGIILQVSFYICAEVLLRSSQMFHRPQSRTCTRYFWLFFVCEYTGLLCILLLP